MFQPFSTLVSTIPLLTIVLTTKPKPDLSSITHVLKCNEPIATGEPTENHLFNNLTCNLVHGPSPSFDDKGLARGCPLLD
ncbi:hypothetical protein M758_6G157100 [Ceratodon purpureus]|uniref:Secreted protein n=1 Tax=Ceratodon purpureus TaxID=3225 RepID=A0A8T0HHY9_CERPU|nr:hypothetical protein KC19_6G163700 [Ceratodon purpureus]KAG0614182.1 hypothetical protein M758_6G157100 [Ceratodon purpureus]